MAQISMQDFMITPQEITDIAIALTAKHGAAAQNVAAQMLAESVSANNLEEYQKWLAVRRHILENGDIKRYTRRLSDKLIWAIEQALETDLPQLAAVLGVVAEEARRAEQNAAADIRAPGGSKRPPMDGGLDPDPPEYTRRLSDKLIWALQQSVDQGKLEIAAMLKPLYEVASEGDAARAAAFKNRS